MDHGGGEKIKGLEAKTGRKLCGLSPSSCRRTLWLAIAVLFLKHLFQDADSHTGDVGHRRGNDVKRALFAFGRERHAAPVFAWANSALAETELSS